MLFQMLCFVSVKVVKFMKLIWYTFKRSLNKYSTDIHSKTSFPHYQCFVLVPGSCPRRIGSELFPFIELR